MVTSRLLKVLLIFNRLFIMGRIITHSAHCYPKSLFPYRRIMKTSPFSHHTEVRWGLHLFKVWGSGSAFSSWQRHPQRQTAIDTYCNGLLLLLWTIYQWLQLLLGCYSYINAVDRPPVHIILYLLKELRWKCECHQCRQPHLETLNIYQFDWLVTDTRSSMFPWDVGNNTKVYGSCFSANVTFLTAWQPVALDTCSATPMVYKKNAVGKKKESFPWCVMGTMLGLRIFR